MYAIIEQNFKAIVILAIMLLMGLALFTGPASSLASPSKLTDRPAASGERPVAATPIEISIRHNGE